MDIPKIGTETPAHWRKGTRASDRVTQGGLQITAEKFEVYTHVTNQIVAQIEAGTPLWRKLWTGGGGTASLQERFNAEAYRGINILMLLGDSYGQGLQLSPLDDFQPAKPPGAMSSPAVRCTAFKLSSRGQSPNSLQLRE